MIPCPFRKSYPGIETNTSEPWAKGPRGVSRFRQLASDMELPSAPLLAVGLLELAHRLGPIHLDRSVDRARLRPSIVFEDFDHQSRVI